MEDQTNKVYIDIHPDDAKARKTRSDKGTHRIKGGPKTGQPNLLSKNPKKKKQNKTSMANVAPTNTAAPYINP